MDVVPCPIAFEFFGAFSQVVDDELIADLEERAGTLVNIRSSILFRQFWMVGGFQNSDFAGWKWGHKILREAILFL